MQAAMPLQRTYYEILGVAPSATPDEIKRKYRELARKYHPDLVADKTLGQKVFAQINMAYRTVGDAERRRQYDSTLNPGGGASAASRPGATMGPGSSRATGVSHSSAATATTGTRPPGARTASANVDPDEVDRLLANADSALLRSQTEAAITICKSVLKLDPRNGRAYMTMGDAYMQHKQYKEADASYRKSLELMPSSLVRNKLSQLRVLMSTLNGATADDAPPGDRPTAPRPPKAAEPEKKRGFFGRLLNRNQ